MIPLEENIQRLAKSNNIQKKAEEKGIDIKSNCRLVSYKASAVEWNEQVN